MRNIGLKNGVKAVANNLLGCAKTTYLYTLGLCFWQPVHKTGSLYVTYTELMRRVNHSQKLVCPSVITLFLPTIHTTYKDHKNYLNLFSY